MTELSSQDSQDFVEHVTTPLNACSVESLPHPIKLSQAEEKWAWPVMVGCYQLDESTKQRKGHLDLYAVPVPSVAQEEDDDDNGPLVPVKGMGAPMTVLGRDGESDASGILDGKWCPRTTTTLAPMVYATAHASGEIQLHRVQHANKDVPFQVSKIGQSSNDDNETSQGLCLALSWDLPRTLPSDDPQFNTTPQKIISSYSNGQVAIHNVHFTSTEGTENSNPTATVSTQFDLIEQWSAHTMFHSPAEVWAASFTTHSHVVLSGGDEGKLKLWDLRAGTMRPMQTLELFGAGVTVLSPHSRREHWVACGSYDETMAILDLRHVSSSQSPDVLCHSESLGGGMWRIKWHPKVDTRLLVGAMHGGCRVVDLISAEETTTTESMMSVHVLQEFTQHKSMAYGADWLVYQPSSGRNRRVEAAVSCSFYDRALCLWNVKQ